MYQLIDFCLLFALNLPTEIGSISKETYTENGLTYQIYAECVANNRYKVKVSLGKYHLTLDKELSLITTPDTIKKMINVIVHLSI